MHLDHGTAVDRYLVEGPIGRGGVASVYRVRHEALGTVHALKVVHVPSPAITERLLREGRAQGKLRHPNVVAVTDLVNVRGAPGLVMELVPGPSLDRFLKEVPLQLDEADSLARGILAGVAAAHRAGLVHRDLKPGNVLLEVEDDRIVPKIVDFGLAKALTAQPESPIETRAGASMGTPAYMAPEQIDDASSVDERADVFALGAILFELATGVRAFRGESVPEVYAKIRAGEHAPIPDGLPARMQRAIEGALRIDRDARTASVAELLRQWADDTPEPRVTWGSRALEAARAPSAVPGPSLHTPSSSTFAGEDSRTTHETWSGEDFDLGSTVESASSEAPRRTERRAAGWLLGLLSMAAAGLALPLAFAPRADLEVLRVDGAPTVVADAAVQRQFDEAWTAFLGGDFAESARRLRVVREAAPGQPLPHLLAGAALMFENDVPAALESMTAARTAAAEEPDAPGAGLVEVYRELQLTGDSVGPPLDAWIVAHPEDYLAAVMRAQYCSTTSDIAVCERTHDALLEHDDQQIVAHLARARSWLDLGELDRARQATVDGLAIDPHEPGLLAVEGMAWMAEGAVEEARAAFERSLEADPRRKGPKVALAQLSLLADDGTWDRASAELLAPTVPADQRVEVHTEAAETLLGLGRAEEALAHLEEAVAIEEVEGTPLGVLTALSKRSPVVQLQGDREALAELVSTQLEVVAGNPEIPNPVRNRYATYKPWIEGLLAADAGDRAGLARALERVQRGEFDQRAVVESLGRELAVMDGDLDAIAANASFFWTTCDRQATLARTYDRAGALDRALEHWQAVLESPCRLHRPQRASRVAALIGLAEHTKDPAEREALVAEARELWPDPDPDLPLAGRLAALSEAE